MQQVDLSHITRLLVAGAWLEIEAGSLEPLYGHELFGQPQPMVLCQLAGDGGTAVIRTSEIAGWAPHASAEAPVRKDPAAGLTDSGLVTAMFHGGAYSSALD
jgi:hypothetical protein